MKYGNEPKLTSEHKIICEEMMFYMYLPIKMKHQNYTTVHDRLKIFTKLIDRAILNEMNITSLWEKYIYLTAKHIHVTPEYPGNRPGYHADGFGTEDINYIWTDKYPTVFCIQDFDLVDDWQIHIEHHFFTNNFVF